MRYKGNREKDVEHTTIDEKGTQTISIKKILGTSRRIRRYLLYRLYLTHIFAHIFAKGLHNGDQWEEFCRIKIILHVPYEVSKN